MRELTFNELEEVSGGGNQAISLANTGAVLGTVLGVVAEGGAAAAVTSLSIAGASLGFAFGAGWMLGSWLYKTFSC